MVVASCAFGVVAIAAAIIWLGSRSDEVLSRWSAIAVVISGVFSVLGFVVALIPLWGRDGNHAEGNEESDTKQQQPSGTTIITQEINSSGDAYVVGQGSQIVHNYQPKKKPKDSR